MKWLRQSFQSTTCAGALHNPESHMRARAVVQRDESSTIEIQVNNNLYKIRFTVSLALKLDVIYNRHEELSGSLLSHCCSSNFSPMLLIKHNLPPVSHQFQSSAVSKIRS